MLYQKNKPSWMQLLAPVAWLACRVLESLFANRWHKSKEIPYDKNLRTPEDED